MRRGGGVTWDITWEHWAGQRESHGNMRGRVTWRHEGGVTCDGNTC